MIIKISWRNVWRNKLRSSVLILSIALGIWAGVFLIGIALGMTNQRRENAINTTLSHIQIHHPDFKSNHRLTDTIGVREDLEKELSENSLVKSFTGRSIISGMLSNSRGGSMVTLMGIYPESERKVTRLFSHLIAGHWFEANKKNTMILGEKLMKKLKIKLRSKVVITFQNQDQDIVAGAFRVVGVYKSASTQYDERTVYLQHKDLEGLLGEKWGVMEIAVMAHEFTEIDSLASLLMARFKNEKIEPWNVASPELGYADAMMDQYLYIMMFIILLAMVFGILNTMLMAVLERRRELGMIMAVGMNKSKVFAMIMWETVMICIVGGVIGIALGYASIEYWGRKGIDLSLLKEGLENWGIQTMLYPELSGIYYVNIFAMIFCTAIIAAIYPAFRALRLNPSEAMRQL